MPDLYGGRFPQIDLAPYKFTDSEFAIGLRIEFLYSHSVFNAPRVYGTSKNLYLFRIVGEKLVELFRELTDESDSGAGYYLRSTIAFSNKKTNGFYNIVVKTNEHKKHNRIKKTIKTYKWNSNQYI